jgi:hypothetical protein
MVSPQTAGMPPHAADLVRAVLAEQAHHAEELLDRVVGSLFHVGLSLHAAAGQPAELARERISEALQRLDDTIREIRDHVFRSRRRAAAACRPGDIVPWHGPIGRWTGDLQPRSRDLGPYPPGEPAGCTTGMFIGDEARAAASAAAATARLAGLAAGGSLIRASHAAWGEGTARIAPAAGLPELVVVQSRGPARRGAVSLLILRWEAAAASGQLFPVLDADITLVPDGEQATLVGLDGVYRTPPGAGLDPVIVHQAAAATIRSFLGHIADAIADPAAARSGDTGYAAVWPGTLAVTSP